MTGPVRDYLLLPGTTPARAARLADLLVKNGIEVRRVTDPAKVKAKEGLEGASKDWSVPAGSYHVTIAQPAGRLARSLLDPRFDMGEAFRKRQLDRKVRRLGDEIYDLTAWSLPLAFGVTSLAVEGPSKIASEPVAMPKATGRVNGPAKARVGYLIPAEDDAAMVALGGSAPPRVPGPCLRPADEARRREVRQGDAPAQDRREPRHAPRSRSAALRSSTA